ncbi:MAG TPA: hypothetical protein VID47_02915 [Actinomycetota bacterium]|jgi:hypothetical protein
MLVQHDHEPYSFMCLRCSRTWTDTYDVRVAHDRAGNEWRMYFLGGVARTSPEADLSCPSCGGLRVKVLPAPLRT